MPILVRQEATLNAVKTHLKRRFASIAEEEARQAHERIQRRILEEAAAITFTIEEWSTDYGRRDAADVILNVILPPEPGVKP